MKWILCDERLPDDNREVLISLEWGIDIGTYERGEWRSEWINHYDDDNVLAWMPLPKPYKADRKTEPSDKDINVRSKTMRDCYNCERYENDCECIECHYEPKTEPQTCNDCDQQRCDKCVTEIGKDEPQTETGTDCSWK